MVVETSKSGMNTLTASGLPAASSWMRAPLTIRLLSLACLIVAFLGAYRLKKRAFPDALGIAPDLKGTYLSARAWGRGQDPYDFGVQSSQWREVRSPGEVDLEAIPQWFQHEPTLYPPTTLVVLFPLTAVPWKAVRPLWMCQNFLLSLLAYLALCDMLGLSLSNWRAHLLAALWLNLGPFVTSIKLATLTCPAVMLDVLTIWAVTRERRILAGVLLGIATALKPQLSGALLLFYFLYPVWKTAWVATGLLAAASAVGVAKLWLDGVRWLPSLRSALSGMTAPGAFNDASRLNPSAWQIVNLQYLLYGALSNRTLVNVMAFVVTMVLSVIFLIVWKRSQSAIPNGYPIPQLKSDMAQPRSRQVLAASISLLLSILPVYHRYYDCLVLTITLSWGIAFVGTSLNWFAWFAILSTSPFFANWPYLLELQTEANRIPIRILDSWWWQTLVMPCQVWTIIALILVLMAALRRLPASPTQRVA